jgi:hypothetical protein
MIKKPKREYSGNKFGWTITLMHALCDYRWNEK